MCARFVAQQFLEKNYYNIFLQNGALKNPILDVFLAVLQVYLRSERRFKMSNLTLYIKNRKKSSLSIISINGQSERKCFS